MSFQIMRGAGIGREGAPGQPVQDGPPPVSAGLMGLDHPAIRPAFAVAVGDAVSVGQVLFTDRAHPRIAFASPVAGVVASIELGARRTLGALVIGANAPQGTHVTAEARDDTGDLVRETLLARGLWPAFRSRPYGHVPAPDALADAIFVSAMRDSPSGVDARAVMAGCSGAFDRGVVALSRLTLGPVFICQEDGPPLGPRGAARVTNVTVAPGLAGPQIHRLCPVGAGRSVWVIGWQDVVAIGHLFETGEYLAERIVALTGPRLRQPRLVRTVPGARLGDLVQGELQGDGPVRLWSGPALTGREAVFLGRHHSQVTVIDGARPARRGLLARLDGLRKTGGARPLVPLTGLERAFPFDIPAVPLMRALGVADLDAARRLGCLELLEEDVAVLTALCTSGADYGRLLRDALNEMETAQ